MIRGSLARLPLTEIPSKSCRSTRKKPAERNASRGNTDRVPFASGENKIHHVIYIIKENRTFDQVFGDLGVGDGDPSITMYGADITPNQHALAKQFGVLDNFYDSGDVSGDGHVWSTSASVSDYIAKTIPIGYRGHEHTYDSEGEFLEGISVEDELPDAGEPTGGYLWKNFAAHGVTYRHYGEYIVSRWCNAKRKRACRRPDHRKSLAHSARARSSKRANRSRRMLANRAADQAPIRGIFQCWRRTSPPSRNCVDTSIPCFPISKLRIQTNSAWMNF